MPYAKGTVEICILCKYAMQRSIYVYIVEYIGVPMKEADEKKKKKKKKKKYNLQFLQLASCE